MNTIYLLKIFNWCFILTGNGSVKLIQRTWMLMCLAWRSALITLILIGAYNGNKWAISNILNIMDPTSIVLIISAEFMILGPLFSITWRLYFDNELSNILKTFTDTLDVLKKFHREVILKTTIFWIGIVILVMHFMVHVTSMIGFIIINKDYSLFDWVVWSYTFIYNRCMYYEYMFLITFVQIIVYKLNDEISKGIIPISELSTMYANTMETLVLINRTIVGPSVLINIIFGYVSLIIFNFYNFVLFKDRFVKISNQNCFLPILSVSLSLFDIVILYYLCQTTENEIRRTTLILNKRSLTANFTLQRKVAFFSLRRLHADFHFELCGFYKINLRQLFTLLFKTAMYLTIQMMQFNITTVYQTFNRN